MLGGGRFRATEQGDEDELGIDALLKSGAKHGGDPGKGFGSFPGSMAAAAVLPGGDDGSQGLLGEMIGCWQLRVLEKGEQGLLLIAEVFGELTVFFLRWAPCQQPFHGSFEAPGGHCQSVGGDFAGVAAIAQLEGFLEQALHGVGETWSGPGFVDR